MPNHCETDLTISGPKAVVDLILKAHFNEEGELNLDSVIPYPKEYKDLDAVAEAYEKAHPGDWAGRPKDGFNSGGYDWCVKNWGTKWGTYEGQGIHRNSRSADVSFQTAWAPPTPVFDKLAAMYPAASFHARSYEQGAGYQTDYRWKKGIQTHGESFDYNGHRGG